MAYDPTTGSTTTGTGLVRGQSRKFPSNLIHGGGRRDSATSDYNLPPSPSLEDLTKKHLANVDIPSDPEGIYENIMGPARQDINRATEKIGLGLQARAAGGSSYEDMLSRYLPEAIQPLADTASQAGAQSEKFAQQGAIAKQQAANELAIAEKSITEESRRFMLDLKARVDMAEREIRAKERIAISNARSAEHVARIRANTAREVARIGANAQMETTKFSQTQENYRNNVRMQVYDKYFTGQIELGQQKNILAGAEFTAKFPNVGRTGVPTSGKPLPDPFANYPNQGYGGGEGGARGTTTAPDFVTGTPGRTPKSNDPWDRITTPGLSDRLTKWWNKQQGY